MTAQKNFKLPETLGNAILQYLGKRPYEEVHQFIAALQAIEELTEVEADKPEIKKAS